MKRMSEWIDGILYVQDAKTGKCERLTEIKDIDLNPSDDVIDERITRWLGNDDEMTFAVKLPDVIETTAREEN